MNDKKQAENPVIDLFAGCGGLSLGFQNAGFSVTAAADNWPPALAVYKLNFHHNIYHLDLSDVKTSVRTLKKHKAGIIVGGPPCQDFSQAGKRNENLGRGGLTVSFAEIIAALKPNFFVMENVDRLVSSVKFKTAARIFKKSGYGLTVRLLNAALCGAPQNRKRFFVIGELGGRDDFLGPYIDRSLGAKPLTVREFLGNEIKADFYYRHPWSYKRRGVYSIDEPSATVRGVNRPVPPGYPGHHLDATKKLGEVRPLTTLERARVQTFPKNFQWAGTKTEREQMIGNAVPVKLAEFVARRLIEYLCLEDKRARKTVLAPPPACS